MKMYTLSALISILIIFTGGIFAQNVSVLPSIKDNSMFSESGSKSLGAGKLFTGQTCQGNNRRALIEFDLSGIPSSATITEVTLRLGAENSGANGDGVIEILGMTREWGEGFSSGSGNGGPAAGNDATWTDAMFMTEVWDTPGGDFDPAVLSSRFTNENNQTITFPSSANFVARAQQWVTDVNSNHGILIRGVENQTCTAYRFGARDIGISPELVVTWTPDCETSSTFFFVQACETYISPGGFVLEESGQYTEVLTGFNGCDSIVNIGLTILETSEFTIAATLCEGQTYTLEGIVFDQNNPSGQVVFQAENGCDSTVIIDLNFVPNASAFIGETLCDGENFSVIVGGNIYDVNNPDGTELLENSSFNGCDSTVNINLVFLPPAVGEVVYGGCEGDGFSVVVNGNVYDETQPSGAEVFVGMSQEGCDSTVFVDLVFNAVVQESVTYSGCEGDGFEIEIDGTIYDENNPFGTINLISSAGCDSFIMVELFFAIPPNAGIAAMPLTICNSGASVVDLSSLLVGADAGGSWIETSINPSTGFSDNQFDGNGQIPGTYTFRYTVISTSDCPNDFTEVTVTVDGPNTATVTTTVNIQNNNNSGNISILNFNTLITAGSTNGTWTDTDITGVDLTDLSNVDFVGVLPGVYMFTYTTSATGNCPGQSYSTSVVVEDGSCPSVTVNENYSGCEGDNYEVVVNNTIYNQNNPTGIEIMMTVAGCDSIVNVDLDFNAPGIAELMVETCDISGPAFTTDTISNGAFNGCDSIVNIAFTYLGVDSIAISATTCDSNDVGVTSLVLTNINGCDSVVTTTTSFQSLDNNVTVSNITLISAVFGADYQWVDCDNNNAPIMGATSQSFTAEETGNYAVIISQDGCTVMSACNLIVIVNTEIAWFQNQLAVMPNPTSGNVRLTFGDLENVNIRILDLMGRVLLEEKGANGGAADLRIEGAAGVYFLEVEVAGARGWIKVVKN